MAHAPVKAGRPYEAPGRWTARQSLLRWSAAKPRREARKINLTTPENGPAAGRLKLRVARPPADGYVAATHLSFLSPRNFLVLAAMAAIAVLLVLGLVRSNHQAVAYSYEISRLTQDRVAALEENRQLKMELARITSLDQLETAAKKTLGLVVPRKGQIVVLD